MPFTCNAKVYKNILLSGCALPDTGKCAPGELELGHRCVPDDRRLDYLRCFHRQQCDGDPAQSASACEALGACDRALCNFDAVTEFELSRLQCVPSEAASAPGAAAAVRAPLAALELKDLSTRHYDYHDLIGPSAPDPIAASASVEVKAAPTCELASVTAAAGASSMAEAAAHVASMASAMQSAALQMEAMWAARSAFALSELSVRDWAGSAPLPSAGDEAGAGADAEANAEADAEAGAGADAEAGAGAGAEVGFPRGGAWVTPTGERGLEWRTLAHLKTLLAMDLLLPPTAEQWLMHGPGTRDAIREAVPDWVAPAGDRLRDLLSVLPAITAYDDICCLGTRLADAFPSVVTAPFVRGEYERQARLTRPSCVDLLRCGPAPRLSAGAVPVLPVPPSPVGAVPVPLAPLAPIAVGVGDGTSLGG